MHAPFRRAGAAGGIEPEGRRVAAGRFGFELRRPLRLELGIRGVALAALAHHDDVAKRRPVGVGEDPGGNRARESDLFRVQLRYFFSHEFRKERIESRVLPGFLLRGDQNGDRMVGRA